MVKLDIISGFLGAGKTTFIKKLAPLCIAAGERVVIIENEFGKTAIDGQLLKSEGFNVIEISGGCICCTLKDDIRVALTDIINTLNPDRIIFEPSGIFVPEELIDLLKEPQISQNCVINSIINIVDAGLFLNQRKRFSYFFESQCKSATCFVLSKTKLVPNNTIKEITEYLYTINPNTPALTKSWDSLNDKAISALLSFNCRKPVISHTHNDHSKLFDFETFGFKTSKEFSLFELYELLEKMQSASYGNIVRCKGLVKQKASAFEFNYVDGNINVEPISTQIKEGKVNIVGINLNKSRLCKLFKSIKLSC